MKKFLNFSLAALFAGAMISCSSCNSKGTDVEDNVTVIEDSTDWVVENVTNTDKQYMFTTYGKDYRWFETCLVLSDWLDTENFDGSVENITNVFQVVSQESSTTFDVHVIFAEHTKDASVYNVQEGFWVEDSPLNDDTIKLTYKDAFDRIMETNSPKPHTKNCILRQPIGILDCNPQYVFGNTHEQLWVDAVNGTVSESNPAFPKGEGFKMPLGEWP